MIKLGNNDISLKLGNDTVDAVYLGNTLVYSGNTPTPPTPTGDCIDIDTEGTTIIIDPNFDTTIPIYGMNFDGLTTLSEYENGQANGQTDIFDENGNFLGSVYGHYDNDNQSGDISVDSGYTQIYTAGTLTVDLCQLFGGPVYVNTDSIAAVDTCDMYDCTEYECLELDEETGECVEQGDCIQNECVGGYTTNYVSYAIVANDALQGGESGSPAD